MYSLDISATGKIGQTETQKIVSFRFFRSPLIRTKMIADGKSLSKQIMTLKPYAFVNLIKLPAALTRVRD